MIRIIISFGMLVHGLIHILGFSREWSFSPTEKIAGRTVEDLSEKTSRLVGLLWLVSSILFMAGALLFAINEVYFWIPSVAALLLSQSLIILYWDDAKFGTMANVLVLVVIIFASANLRFISMANSTADNIIRSAKGETILVTKDMITNLPAPVRKWMNISNVIDRPTRNIIHITQEGSMRSRPGGNWMPFHAQQTITIDPPAFVWTAKMKAASIFDIAAVDSYQQGHGNMLIKALYIYNVADASGPEIDQGTLVRYLAEMAWYPQAATSEYIRWEEIDDSHARAIMTYNGVSASGIFTFNGEGYLTGFSAERYGDFDGAFRKENWVVSSSKFRVVNDLFMASTSDVTWRLKDGDFTWLTLEITDLE